MEGKKLIIKRRVPRGRQQLVIVFLGGLLVIFFVFVVQLRTTLSARTLAKVGSDVANMREEFGSFGSAATGSSSADEDSAETSPASTTADDLATLKTYMEAAMKAEATPTDASVTAPTDDATTPPTEPSTTPTP